MVTVCEGPPLTVQFAASPLTVTVSPSRPGVPPVVVVVTVKLPVGGGGVGQLIENAAEVDPPSGTVTVCEGEPLTEQFAARPLRVTVWLPAARLSKVTLPFVPIG